MARNTIQNPNGKRFEDYKEWDKKLHMPYDYKRYGLMNRITSHKIWGTKNPFLRYMVNYIEKSLIFCMRSADELANFYNYNWKNR